MIDAMVLDPKAKRTLKIEKVENTLKSLQDIVGGRIENTYRWETDETYAKESGIISFDLYTDEEAKLKDYDRAFILVTKEGEQLSPILVGKGVIVGSDFEGNTVAVDAWELMKFVFVKTICEGEPNWEKVEMTINHEIARGAVWSR